MLLQLGNSGRRAISTAISDVMDRKFGLCSIAVEFFTFSVHVKCKPHHRSNAIYVFALQVMAEVRLCSSNGS
jgi:hypothetical protein